VKPPLKPVLEVRIGDVELTTENGSIFFEVELIPNCPFSPTARLEVFDLSLEVEKAVLKGVEVPVEVVYGWTDSENRRTAGLWKGRVVKVVSLMEGKVVRLVVECVSEGAVEIYREDKQVRRRGKVDVVLRELANESGLKADVDEVDMEIDRLQLNMSNYDFIRKVILPYVNSRSSDDPYGFWINNGILHFKRLRITKREFFYGLYTEDDFSNILSLETEMNLLPGLMAGDSISVTKIDPNTKQVTDIRADNFSAEKKTVLGKSKAVIVSKRKRVVSHGLDVDSITGAAKNLYGWFSNMPFRLTMTILGNLEVRVQDTINVNVFAYTGKEYTLRPISGRYLVTRVKHRVDTDGFLTELTCLKNAYPEGSEKAVGVKAV